MLAVFDFITVRKLAIKLSVKTFIIRSVHSKFHVIITSITAVGMLIKPLFGSSVAIFWLACSDISLSMNEKKLEGSPGNGRHSTIWQTA